MDQRSKLAIWADAAHRYALANTLSGVLPIYVVVEYPKSGGTWVGQMLADYLALPFPRNRWVWPVPAVHHAHYLYSPLMRKPLCVMRDGRDIMVSFYFHMCFENEKSSPHVVHETRRALNFADYDDVRTNLPAFIRYLFAKQAASASPFQFTWPEFVRSWSKRGVVTVRYEDLVADCVASLTPVLHALTGKEVDPERVTRIAERYSFAAQAKRPAGEEKRGSFLRKGQPGDWREKFTPEAAEVFRELAGAELKALGYVADDSWVDEVRDR